MTWVVNRMDRAPSQVLPQTIWSVERCTVRNRLGEGVKRLGSIGSSVIVGRMVGVKVGGGGSVTRGGPVAGVVVGACVLITKRSGVCVAGSPKGVAVGWGRFVCVGVPRKGIESGTP